MAYANTEIRHKSGAGDVIWPAGHPGNTAHGSDGGDCGFQ